MLIQGIVIVWLVLMLGILSSCAAVPLAAGYFTSGGVTLYKSAKEYGPKAEFVVLKVEANHIVYQGGNCSCRNCRK